MAKKKSSGFALIGVILLIIILLVVVFAFSRKTGGEYDDEKLNALASCLADKGVKEYGAFWCPNCAKQEKMFGVGYGIIKSRSVYVECDPRCDVPASELPRACRGVVGQTELCLQKGVEKYPHWEFQDGSTLIGVQELNVLAEKAGCQFP
ncbi:hypothetical protein HYV50_04255 [Candidatus Pacearchaeota archaeon]|nr:hypothetical protein [Candidatus Pacearchaeota archaeon]